MPSLLRVAVGLRTGARLPAVSVFPARDAVLVKYAPVPLAPPPAAVMATTAIAVAVTAAIRAMVARR